MRLARVAAGVLIGVVLLAGCSDSPAPANDTLPSAAPTSAEASQTLPPLGPPDFPMPAEARQQTPEGALAAARYFIQLTVFAYQRAETQSIATLSRDCEYCEALVLAVEEDSQAGNRVAGGDVTFEDSGQVVVDQSSAEVAFSLSQAPLTVRGPDSEEISERAQGAFQVFTSIGLTWSAELNAWIVNQVTTS